MKDLCAYLQEHKGWTQEQIAAALDSWRQARDVALAELEGVRVRVDGEGYLIWERFPEQEILDRVRVLPEPPVGHAGARSLIWIEPESGKQLDLQTLPADSPAGLVVAGRKVFLHAPVLENAPLLAQTNVWVDTALPDTRQHHIDLQVLPDRELLFVLHREGGVVHVYHLHQRIRLASWQIRSQGNSLAINLSFDRSGLKAYLTDNVTPQLWIADLANLELKLWKSGLGVLGNLLAAPEPGCLYLTILKPNFNLIYFELDTMSALYSVEIRGEPLTGRRLLAWDPFMADADSDLLYYLAGREQSGQTLAVLNIIDANEVRTIKRTVVRSNFLPVLLVSGPDNPFKRYKELDFKAWLLEQDLISEQDIAAATPRASEPKRPGTRPLTKPERKPFRIYQPPAEDPGIWEQVDTPAAHIELPVAAEEVIVDLICWAFYRLTLTNLRIHSGEISTLKKTAKRLRQELQAKQAVLAKLEDVLGRFDFQTPISRAAVLTLLEQRDQSDLVRIEDLCPLCQVPLEESACGECGFRLELPEAERLSLEQVSAEPGSRLLPGQMLLPHPARPLLLTLNLWHQPMGQLVPVGLKSLNHGVTLSSMNVLAVDSVGNKLVELSPSGEVVWKAKLALKKPVMCSFYESSDGPRYLVVDQGNARVLELDRNGKHHRRYPTLKTPNGDKLTSPSDVQQTPQGTWLISDPVARRVLEVDARGSVVRRFGPELGVEAPVAARRKADGSTEILDREPGSVLIFDAQGQLELRYDFWPPADKVWAAEPAPHWACLLHNGEWLLLGTRYLMLVAPRHQRVRWISPLPEPGADNSLLKVGFTTHTGAEVRKKQIEDYVGALRQMELLARESDEQLASLAKHVQSLSFDAGDWLLHPGELGNAVFFVREGELDVIAPEKEKPVMFQIKPGETCGTQAVLSIGDTSWRPGLRVH
ncbi:MAG: cyclic nucleotide-binding domain-containing protein, partial [Candidatus Sericytochromatia bacterium]